MFNRYSGKCHTCKYWGIHVTVLALLALTPSALAQRDLATIVGANAATPAGGNQQGGGGSCGGGGGECRPIYQMVGPDDDCDSLTINPAITEVATDSINPGSFGRGPLPIMASGGGFGGVGLTTTDPQLSGLGILDGGLSGRETASRIPDEIGFGQVGLAGDPVIAGTGEYVFRSVDMSLKHDGTFISIGRIYRHLTPDPSGTADFGPNFHSNLWVEADEIDSDTVDVYLGTGPTLRFTWNSSSSVWDSPTGYERYLLEKIATTGNDYYYRVTDNNGYRYIFEEETSTTSTPYMLDMTENRYGQGQTYNYTAGYVSSIDCNSNLTITITRNGDNQITKIEDTQGREVNYKYATTGAKALLEVSDLCGTCSPNTSVRFEYDGDDYLNKIYNGDDDLVRTITYTSDVVSSYKDYFNNTWSFAYTATTATVTDPYSVDTEYTIDTDGNVTQMVVADGVTGIEATYDFTYDASLRLTSIENPDASDVNYYYDDRNRVTAVDVLANSVTINAVEYSYHSDGRVDIITDALGNDTAFTYNEKLELTKITYPDSSERTFTYSGAVNGLPTTITDEAGVEHTYEYDANGFNTKIILANGTADEMVEMSQTFDDAGRLTARKLADKPVATYTYDEAGDVTQIVQGDLTTDFTYDTDSNLLTRKITDTSGTTTVVEHSSYTYNEMGWRLTEKNELVNETTTYTFDDVGLVETVTDPAGLVTERFYDERNRLEEVKVGDGTTMATRQKLTYDSMNRVLTIEDGEENVAEREYDDFGRLAKSIDPTDDYTTFDYDDAGQVTDTYRYKENGATDILISRSQNTINNRGRVTKVRQFADADGSANNTLDAVTDTTYDDAGKVTCRSVAISSTVSMDTDNTYDADTGKLIKVTDPENKETEFTYYTSTGLRHEVENPLNEKQGDTYDEWGRVSKTTYPDQSYITFEYNHRGQKIEEIRYSSTNVKLAKTTYAYDGAGRATETRRWADPTASVGGASDHYTKNTYGSTSNEGRVISTTNASGEVTTYTYDATYGYRTKVTLPDGSYTEYSNFDGNGRGQTVTLVEKTTGQSDKTTVTKYEFDELGRVVKITDNGPDGTVGNADDREILYEFDAAGRQTKVTDAGGMVTETEYNDLGRKVKVTEDSTGIARVTEFEYDNAGRMTKLIAYKDSPSTGKEETSYEYDGRGLVTKTTYPVTGDVTQVFDAAGNMTQRTDEAGVVVVYTYDSETNLLTERKESGATTEIEKFYYNQLLQLTKAEKGELANSDADSKSEFGYDALGRVIWEKQTIQEGTTRQIDYEYDAAGNRTKVTYHDGTTEVDFTYDDRDRVSAIDLNSDRLADLVWRGNAVFSKAVTCDYPGATQPKFKTAYTRDGLMRVTKMATTHQTSNQADSGYNDILTIDFTYDDASNPLSALQNQTTWNSVEATYSYDTLNRVVGASLKDTQTWTAASATSNWWDYDDVGNRTGSVERSGAEKGYTHDLANRTTAIGPTGSPLSQTYDLAGNLTETAAIYNGKGYDLVYDHNNRLIEVWDSTKTNLLQEWSYDALGRMVRSDDKVNDEVREIYYDGVSELMEYDESGNMLRYYVRSPEYVDAMLMLYDGDSQRPYYYVLGRMYEVLRLIDRAGAVVESYAYDVYGLAHIRSGTRGSFKHNSAITTNDIAYHATVVSGTNWNPIGDIDDDGDVDSTDSSLIAARKDAWDGEGGDNAIVARAFSKYGNRFLFQGRPRYAIDTQVYESDGASLDNFGVSCGIDGDYAVISSYLHDEGATDAGSVYVYRYNGSKWVLDVELVADDAAASDVFGSSVAISGDTVVVGANLDDDNGASSGSVYVYVRDVNGWSEQQKLTASDGAAGDHFGTSVAIDGDWIVVGAQFWEDGSSGGNAGAAYVFSRSGSTWSEDQLLEASDQAANDWFGRVVDIDGERIVVGAHEHDVSSTSDAGQAYVFDYNSGTSTWDETAILAASDTEAEAEFGRSVTVSGDRVAIGAPYADSGSPTITDSGAVYVFEKDQGGTANWGQTVKLTASDTAAGDWFTDPQLDGDRLVVGAMQDDDNGGQSGSLYVFDYNSGTSSWDETEKVTPGDGGASDYFTIRAIDGDRILAGSLWDDDAGSGSGSAYIFDKDNGGTDNWGESQKIVALAPLQPAMPSVAINDHRGRMFFPIPGIWAVRDLLEYNPRSLAATPTRENLPTGASNPVFLFEGFANAPTRSVDPSGLAVPQCTFADEIISEGTIFGPVGLNSALTQCPSHAPHWVQLVHRSRVKKICGSDILLSEYSTHFFEVVKNYTVGESAGLIDTLGRGYGRTIGGGQYMKERIEAWSLCLTDNELLHITGGGPPGNSSGTCLGTTIGELAECYPVNGHNRDYFTDLSRNLPSPWSYSYRMVDIYKGDCNCCYVEDVGYHITNCDGKETWDGKRTKKCYE